LKWPNDLEIDGRKVGGILCEHAQGPVVAGIGLNVSQKAEDFPRGLSDRAVSLEMAGGQRISVGRLATALLRELRARCAGNGGLLPDEARAELAARDVLRDRPVHTQQAGEGVARGIDADGALVVEQEGGRRVRVVAGTVRIR
jgi:BirA family biotin operon repressor/biotin-[acetyl-CoA-carboxylase] ligase